MGQSGRFGQLFLALAQPSIGEADNQTMNLKSAVASALLGTMVAGGASAGVISTMNKNDNPVITFDASVAAPGTTATLPQVDVEAETPAGTVGVDNTGGGVNVTTPIPGVGGKGTATVSTGKPGATVAGGIVLPGLDVAGLGEILRKVTGADLSVVNDLMKLLPADIHQVLGQVLLNTPARDMDEIIGLLRVVDANEATKILGVLRTLSPEALGVLGDLGVAVPGAQMQEMAGLFTSLPDSVFGQFEDLLSVLNASQLSALGSLFVQTPHGQMQAAGKALVDPGLLSPSLLNNLLGSVLSILQPLTEGLLGRVIGLGLTDQTLDIAGHLMQVLSPQAVTQMGTVFGALGADRLALLNQFLDVVPLDQVEMVADMVNSIGVTKMPVVGGVFSTVAASAVMPLADLLAFAPKGVPLRVVGDLFGTIL